MTKTIHAVWKNGQIVPTQPVDWPEGTALAVEPIEESLVTDPQGDLLGDDPASIARQQFPTRDFRPENMLVLISHFANSLRIMPSRIPYLTAWANGVARNGYCSG